MYFTSIGQSNVYRYELVTGEIKQLKDPENRELNLDKFDDLEIGSDGILYISDIGSSFKSVVDYWRIPNPDSDSAYIELAYRNTNYIKYPLPPKGKLIRSVLPDFPPFLYDKNYRFPTPLEVATPLLQFEGTRCFSDPIIINNLSPVLDSTTWELWKGSEQLQTLTAKQLQLEGLSPGSYSIKATNYTQCIDGETATLNFELDSLPLIALDEDSLVLCDQLENKQGVHVQHNTYDVAEWNTQDLGDTIVFQGAGEFVASVKNNCGIATDTLIQTVEEFDAPNIITPNGDGKNEAFVVSYSEELPLDLDVYNRLGSVVYSSKDYQNNWSPKELTNGTYYYSVTTEQKCSHKGWLQIMK